CFFIDVSSQANMGFRDEIDGDGIGGWFDQGMNDLRNMVTGKQILANVPFGIINPTANNGKSAIILFGKARTYFPAKISGIPVNRTAARLYFLHGMGWKDEGIVLSYQINYANGETAEIPITYGNEISGWWSPQIIPNAKIAFEAANTFSKRVGVYCYRWENPKPKMIIKAIDIISAKNNAVPVVLAITGEN
ncbi:MAG TPA: glycoside hydrolase family 2, partial [Spirochaetia bacterium]|nr:glycoside hydrolase family 2 [Spirochaetia bacterium]